MTGSPADPVTGSDAGPTPGVVVSNGQTLVETPSIAHVGPDASPTPVVVVSNGKTSGGFGVRFAMTALGLVLKLFWTNLDQGKLILFPLVIKDKS